jgi:probable HAF family extracellular repeat protein
VSTARATRKSECTRPPELSRWLSIETGPHTASTIKARLQATREPAPQRITPYGWEKDGTATPLDDLGVPGASQGIAINDQGQIVGQVFSADGTTAHGALWQYQGQNYTITSFNTLPGDFFSFAEGINNQGQVVGSTQLKNGDWSHAFIYQNGVMTDLNTLFPASSNLYATMANKINESGQISGMATVLTGPDAGNIHAFLATPVNQSIGRSMADVARTHPKTNLPGKVGNQLLHRFGLGQFGR